MYILIYRRIKLSKTFDRYSYADFFFKVYLCVIGWICTGFFFILQSFNLPAFHILQTTG